jgi:hypothetical protein
VAVQEATAVEATVVLVAEAVVAAVAAAVVKKLGALSHVSCLVALPEGF